VRIVQEVDEEDLQLQLALPIKGNILCTNIHCKKRQLLIT